MLNPATRIRNRSALRQGAARAETGAASRLRSVSIRGLGLLLVATLTTPVRGQEIPAGGDACVKGMTESTPSKDFTPIQDGAAVRHEPTTLEWKRCSEGQSWSAKTGTCEGRALALTWERAQRRAIKAGDDWRLPTGEELLTIVETCHYAPSVNPQVFPSTPAAMFWSSSLDTGGLGRVWSVSFFGGQHYRTGKIQSGRIRLVRGELKREPGP